MCNLTKFQLIQLIQTTVMYIFSIGCLIELTFCEVSRNSFSNRFWKFQLSILKNKKVLFQKKIFFKPLSTLKQKSLDYRPNFQWRLWIMRAKSMQNAPRACANQSNSCSSQWGQIISEVALEFFQKSYNATLEKVLAPLCSLSLIHVQNTYMISLCLTFKTYSK